jgi:hypothetical protein
MEFLFYGCGSQGDVRRISKSGKGTERLEADSGQGEAAALSGVLYSSVEEQANFDRGASLVFVTFATNFVNLAHCRCPPWSLSLPGNIKQNRPSELWLSF